MKIPEKTKEILHLLGVDLKGVDLDDERTCILIINDLYQALDTWRSA
jgi:hypothetical protein